MAHKEFLYESFERGVRVVVSVVYLGSHLVQESSFEECCHVWAYSVHIFNKTREKLKLVGKDWKLIDSKGITSEVKVIEGGNEQLLIEVEEEISFTSGTYLNEPSGLMLGKYNFFRESDSTFFSVDIPSFSLDSPEGIKQAN